MTRRQWTETPPTETDGGDTGLIWALNRHSGIPALIPLRSFTPDVFSHWMRTIERKPPLPKRLLPRSPDEPPTMAAEIRAEIDKGLDNAEISDWLGCTIQRAANERRHMRKRALRKDTGMNRAEKRAAREKMILDGKRNTEISEALSCCESTVARHRAKMLAAGK